MWSQRKLFSSLTPFSLLDFKDHTSAILWFSGCNMKCDFCYNPELVFSKGKYSFEDFLEFFQSRKNLLDGIVFCGGEPTLYPEIVDLAKELKDMGFKIKLDTNGLNPQLIKELLDKQLLDYLALDFKAPYDSFEQITKSKKVNFDKFLQTLEILISSKINFEVRTTYHSALLSNDDMQNILDILQSYEYTKTYYIQNFMESSQTIGEISQKNNKKQLKINNSKYDFQIKYRNF